MTLTRIDRLALKDDLAYYERRLRSLGEDPQRVTDPEAIAWERRLLERNIAEIRGELAA